LIYDKIKKLCEEQDISIRQLEIRAGLANGVIRKWNESEPMANTLNRVANVLGTTVEELLSEG